MRLGYTSWGVRSTRWQPSKADAGACGSEKGAGVSGERRRNRGGHSSPGPLLFPVSRFYAPRKRQVGPTGFEPVTSCSEAEKDGHHSAATWRLTPEELGSDARFVAAHTTLRAGHRSRPGWGCARGCMAGVDRQAGRDATRLFVQPFPTRPGETSTPTCSRRTSCLGHVGSGARS